MPPATVLLAAGILLGSVVLVTIIIVAIRAHNRAVARQRAELLAAAQATGFEEAPRPKKELACWKSTQLSRGAENIKIGFRRDAGPDGGLPLILFQHEYVVSTGKSAHTVRHRVAATPVPATWPYVRLSPENVLTRFAGWLGFRDLEVEDQQFNDRWRIATKHPEFAEIALAPEVQAVLRDGEKSQVWVIEEGHLCLIEVGALRPEDFERLPTMLLAVAGAIPPELDAWCPDRDGSG